MRYVIFLSIAASVWPQLVVSTQWSPEGLKGGGFRAKTADSGFFVWTDFEGSGSGALQAGPLSLGDLEWSGLGLAAFRSALPLAWDTAWTRMTRAAPRYEARQAHTWAAALSIEPWLFWGTRASDQSGSLGMGWMPPAGPWWSRWNWELEARFRNQEEKTGWFERPRGREVSWRHQIHLGWGGLDQGMDVLARLEKADSWRPSHLVGLRLGLSPFTGLKLHSLASHDGRWALQQRIECNGKWVRAVQRWDLDRDFDSWHLRSLSSVGLNLESEGWKFKVKAELDIDPMKEKRALLGEVGLGWGEWLGRFQALWNQWEEVRPHRITGSLRYDSQLFLIELGGDYIQKRFRGEFLFRFRHPEVRADLTLPWELEKGVGTWKLLLGRTF